jgi:exosortase D (VPLPA-CTERM-specific)
MTIGSMSVERPANFNKLLLVIVAVLIAVLVFSSSLRELVHRWISQEEYSHGFFIPAISAWLLWTRREALAASIGKPSWAGPVLILLAAAMHVVGELSALYVLSQVGFVVALFGIVLSAGGFPLARVSFIPIVFLLFAIPLPYFIDSTLSYRLQLISSELGVYFIRLFQVPVYLEGNVIDLGQYKLQVVEACSGLRYLYPLVSLGFLAAYLFNAPLWQRAIVFLSTIPITIVMNSFRIGMVGILVDRWGPQSADGLLHFFEGWIIFIACAGLLTLEILVLTFLGSRKSFFDVFQPPVVQPVTPRPWTPSRLQLPVLLAFVLLLAAGGAGFAVTGREEILPERARFATFPTTVADWRGRSSSLEPQVEHALGLTDYVLSDYSKADGRAVNLYVAYYASQRKGQSPHSPSVCIPGNGWQINKFERTVMTGDDGIPLPYNRVVIEKDSRKQLVYYWFEQRGRRIENEWWSKWYLLKDAILMNRTDGALVRLTTPIYSGEEESAADKRLQEFARSITPRLANYLPAAEPKKIMPAQGRRNADHS